MKIWTVGTATLDVFFLFDNLNFFKNPKYLKEKNEVKSIFLDIGGGGLNSAVTFHKLNLNYQAIIKIGIDFIGEIIESKIRKKKIKAKIIHYSGPSALSFIFLDKKGEKYIFVYRGIETFEPKDIPLDKNQCYFITTGTTPVSVWEKILTNLRKNNNIIGILPSKSFLKSNLTREILKKCDFLAFNFEEAQMLLKVNHKTYQDICRSLKEILPEVKLIIITLGEKGSLLINNKNCYFCEAFKRFKIIDTTGAGDNFASTVFGLWVKSNFNMQEDRLLLNLKLASVNVAYNLREIGAQTGLLTLGELNKYKNIKLHIQKLW